LDILWILLKNCHDAGGKKISWNSQKDCRGNFPERERHSELFRVKTPRGENHLRIIETFEMAGSRGNGSTFEMIWRWPEFYLMEIWDSA
jgi:hypothetical protein